ncbi:hypothetical protein CK203_108522 [Vitis vinifera]|uniref:Uncharacterized protein n=1 Tax=Vitis vinifera TaxID=29760 RepID=A0A438C5F0_VITVI|nr:hypothetical protein CK203_108522 [Vitis vinifera]
MGNDGIDMKAKVAAMAKRLEELERKKMQECPTIPAVRKMFGDCNTYNSNWRNHPNFSWKPQPPQYQQPTQALPQASNLEQAMVNLSKVVGDFVGAQKSINAQLSQRIDSVESSLNKNMDGVQNDQSQKIDNLQYSISRVSIKWRFNRESSMVKEVKAVITLRSGKEVDLPTCKLEHKVESEAEKEKREEIKGKKKEKSTEKYDYDFNEEPQRIVIKEEMMKQHMPPLSPSFVWQNHIEQVSRGIAKEVKEGLTAKPPLSTRVPFRNPTTHFAVAKWAAKMPLVAKLAIGCEITLLLRNGLQASKWLRNHLQAEKWPSSCEIDLRNGRRFAKTPCEAKGSCENANRARYHASEEEGPAHPEITHTKPLTPFLTSLNHQSP